MGFFNWLPLSLKLKKVSGRSHLETEKKTDDEDGELIAERGESRQKRA